MATSNIDFASCRPRRLLALVMAAGFAGCATTQDQHPPADLTPDHYARKTEVTPGPNQSPLQLSTEKGFEEPYPDIQHYRGLHLIASIDRKTGQTAYALDFMQMRAKPRTKVTVFYDAPEGLMRQNIYVRNGRRTCKDQVCTILESVSIPLKESLLRHFAARFTPNLDTHWHFRIEPDVEGEVSYAEMAGLLKRVDEARQNNLSRSPAP